MSTDKVGATDIATAVCNYNTRPDEMLGIAGRYEVVCYDKDGNIKWEDVIENLVVTVGRNLILDTVLGNTAAGAVYMGLKGTGTPAAGDTQGLHATWNEVGAANAPTYTSPRKTVTTAFSAASSGSKSASAQSFAITSSGTVAGCFINIGGSSTIDNTTGTLFSAGDFSGGSKSVVNGDTVSVTYTASVTST